MKKLIPGVLLSVLMVLSLILAACTPETTPTTTPTTATTPDISDSSPTPTTTGNWWDDLGEPQYGGNLNLRAVSFSPVSFDPVSPNGTDRTLYFESLFDADWTVDRDVWGFPCNFVPEEYVTGLLAEGYEWTDPQTITVKLKEGIHWQNKEPVNGRELTAEDVQYSYDRLLGTGSGFTEPNSWWTGTLSNIEKVVATDTHTVEFHLKGPGVTSIFQILEGQVFRAVVIVPKEWVEQGDTQNWENAVGSGPWMLTGHESNISLTFTRNPDYWGYDERYPDNQLPYLDQVKYTAIADSATALAALRSGQIDMLTDQRGGAITRQQAESLANTNPEIMQAMTTGPGVSLEIRCDQEPFTDVNVRKALQMAVNRPLIAETYYGGTVDGVPCGLLPAYYTGWTLPYDEWPEELQHEYSYDPEAAIQLLADAGYPNGFDTAIIADAADAVELLEIIKSQFEDIGVNMEIQTMDSGTMRALAGSGDYEGMALSAKQSFALVPVSALEMRTSTNGNNWLRNNDTYFDGLVAQMYDATTMDELKELTTEADMYASAQHWSVFVVPTVSYYVWQPRVKGYSGELFTMAGWSPHLPSRMWIEE